MPNCSPRTARLLRVTLAASVAVAAVLACQPPRTEASEPAFRASVSGVDWELVELQGQTAPTGAGGRRATMRFEADTARVGGFAGCNRYGGTYTLDGSSLRFGPLISTKMACNEGMELEVRLTSALQTTRQYELTSTQLRLIGDAGPVARFTRRIP
jgi:heat shock protein HslJ